MKKFILYLLLTACTLTASSQGKFDPERFTRDQETFITKHAKLSQQEAAAFFPLFREMQQKARPLFKKQRELFRKNPQNDADATSIMNEVDDIDMQLRKLQQQYHKKFCKAIAPTKVLCCLRAEEIFKHRTMERMAQMNNKKPQRRNNK